MESIQVKPPRAKLKIGSEFKCMQLHKKKFKIICREFNPEQAPKSNSWYYTLSFDENRIFREDYLLLLLSGQLELFE